MAPLTLSLVWIGLLLLAGFWSLGMWVLHALATWALGHAATLTAVPEMARALDVPAWLQPWMTPQLGAVLTATLDALAPVVALLVAWAPALGGGLTVAAWIIWGLGASLLLGVGLLGTAAIVLLRRRSRQQTGWGLTQDAAAPSAFRSLGRSRLGRWLRA